MEFKTRSQENVQILQFSGSLDSSTVNEARPWLLNATGRHPARVVVDLSQVEFLDSTGLSVLVESKRRALENDGDLLLCGLRQPVRMVFELTRLDRFFEIFRLETEALAALELQAAG
jgi:anti-sigma B factor antagonist